MKAKKVVFISGASRGIGRATAIAFAKAGFDLALTARASEDGEISHALSQTQRLVQSYGADTCLQAMDLTSTESVSNACNAILEYYSRVDVIVNNAIFQSDQLNAPVIQLSEHTLQNVAHAYMYAPLQIVQHFLPTQIENQAGTIINITSGAGEVDPPVPASEGAWGYAYGAGKAAVSRLSGIIAREHQKDGIVALTVNPGVVNTETLRATIGEQGVKNLKQGVAEPQLIADVLVWLAQDPDAKKLQYKTIHAQSLANKIL